VNQGVRPGDLVALCARRSPTLVAAVLGILKAGAAYVPIDPRYPPDRIAVVLAEARTCLLVTERELVAGLPLAGPPVVVLDDAPAGDLDDQDADHDLGHDLDHDLGRRAGPDDLAYVLFTSGSTGPPKGVMIEHRNTTALLAWAYSVYGDADLACVLAATSICFDLSVFELFVPLCAGHAVALAENVLELPALPARDHVTLINTVPSVMKALLRAPDQRFPGALRVVNLAGERLDASLVDLVYRRTGAQRVYDLYGPTEATTYSTFQLRLPEQPASIGRPIANTRCYVLDPHGSPVPVGVVGELCLAGAGLARGYLHRPALTAERFTRPRSAWIEETRLYHTGDLVRYTAAGDLEYVGRNDDQLKIAGAPGDTIA
jgi:amino acid adenylation domain-containing protein